MQARRRRWFWRASEPPPQLKAILEPFCITMMVQGVSLLGVKGRISLIWSKGLLLLIWFLKIEKKEGEKNLTFFIAIWYVLSFKAMERWLRTPIKLFAKINLQIANKRRVLLQIIRGSLYAAMAQWCIMNVAKKWNWIQHQEEGFWQMARRALNWNSYCFGTHHRASLVWPSLCNRVKFCNAAPLL